ncbi:MAG: 3-deoxy-8-phosphooctulonate synthase [Candidatus Delongbacteria bacterium]|nr:3-deoxy-8-phosphooctulonate synthase [Candidatus Delongbacteria bacterium]MDD4205196.1 3-deoxy-8-phosphooctulonate synthase [Candidatus Delongbacteria bacterium]
MKLKKIDTDKVLKRVTAQSGKLFYIMGPCVIESEDTVMEIAERLYKIATELKADVVFKSSYTKANRSSIESFTGPGIVKGLKILKRVRTEFGFPILTDVHTPAEAEVAGMTADIIQIPAFLCRQTDLILAAAKTGKIINIKKGQFASAQEMKLAAAKSVAAGNVRILLTERGTTFGYNNLVVDFRNFMEMKKTGYPVIYDVTHSLQRPAAEGNTSGGQPEYAIAMACAAAATGSIDGIFAETHTDPSLAMSDSKSMIDLDQAEELVNKTKKINRIKF